MNLAWDRHTHTWDDEMILRTMMLGDVSDYKTMMGEVSRQRLADVFQRKSYEIDIKSQIFWGHILQVTPSRTGFFSSSHHATTPSRHIAV